MAVGLENRTFATARNRFCVMRLPLGSDELHRHLQEVVAMLLEDGEPKLESEFVGVQTIKVA